MAFVLNTVIGIFVYLKNRKGIINRHFVFLTLVLSTWVLGCFMESFVKTKESALFWDRILYTGVALLPPFYIKFIYSFLNKKAIKSLNICWLVSAIFLFFNFASPLRHYLIVDVIKKYTFRFIGIPGFLWYLITIYVIWSCMVGIILSFLEYKKSFGSRRTQMKYFTIGQVVLSTGGTMYFLLLLNVVTPPIDNLLVVVYSTIMAYAIVRHQLMGIEVIIKKTLVYSILISIITISYFIVIFLSERVFSIIVGYRSVPLAIAIIVLFSIISTPLKNKIQHMIDRLFFKGTIDQIEKEKELLGTELQRAERLKTVSTLAAGMAHEIKNPLTSIKTFIEYMDEKYKDPQFRTKFKSIVPKEIDKITNIINQLLDYSRSERVNVKTCNIHNILDYVSDLYNSVFLNKHIKLHKLYTSKTPNITCDENQLKQAFINIILNSIEAMPNAGEITIQTQDIDNTLEVSIKDTGIGIPKDKIQHLFDPFYTTKEKGTGLGLFIVHQIIQNNKGRIAIESDINEGTIVKVRFEKT
ncbi:ATP-binding protein [Omnitrophica bacterium]|nr:ATP-binding protein [Candidatus Omnitrophota bacterium]